MKRLLATTAAAMLALGSSAFAASSITTQGATVRGDVLTLPKVMAGQDGYLVIHAVENGKPVEPQSIGHTPVTKGENDNVAVTTDYPLKPGQSYLAMLHKETNGDGTYDFGKGMTKVDTPMMAHGKPVTRKFSLKASNDQAMQGVTSMQGDAHADKAMK